MHSPKKKPPRRNDAAIPDDVLLPLAPIAPPMFAPPAALSYAMAPRHRSGRVRRALGAAARSARKKAGAVASAIKPEAATIDKAHLLGVGANAAGGITTALLAHEFIDNLGVMPLAIGATVIGGAGSAFLKGNWQRAAQGMLGAGVSQLGTAYLTERALKKAAAAQPVAPPAPVSPAPAPRNAAPERDDPAMVRALERAERRIAAMLDDERNSGGDGIDADLFDAPIYAVPI
jgi:hypothetical protein